MASEAMKVGELARRTGISIRTLHYYEEIGLLDPPRQATSGHRIYGVEEVARLQQILSLRQLDLPLDEIRCWFEHPPSRQPKSSSCTLGDCASSSRSPVD